MNDDKAPVVSVIIPCYNQEKWIRQCLESVEAQDTSRLECIVINDGSTDRSLEVINRFKYDAGGNDRCSWLTVVSQENNGVTVSRNNGIAMARGKYLSFLDADDELTCDSLDVLLGIVTAAPRVDIAGGSFVIIDTDDKVTGQMEQDSFEGSVSDWLYSHYCNGLKTKMVGSLCGKLIRRSIFEQLDHLGLPGMVRGEDAELNLRLYRHAKEIVTISKPIYRYRNTPGSAMKSFRGLNQVKDLQIKSDTMRRTWQMLYEGDRLDNMLHMADLTQALLTFTQISCMLLDNTSKKYKVFREIISMTNEGHPEWLNLQPGVLRRTIVRAIRLHPRLGFITFKTVLLFPSLRSKLMI